MPSWNEIWSTEFLGNSVGEWILATLAFLVTLTVLPLVKRYIGVQRRRWLQGQRALPLAIEVGALLIERTSRWFLLVVALYFATEQLTLAEHVEHWFRVATVLIFWFQVGLWGMAAVRFALNRRSRRTDAADATLASSINIIVFIAGLTIWTMAFLLALDNLGVEIKPLLAGLGIGGIAVALAVQTVLSDLLASMSIALDKPFVVGDSLTVDDLQGTVEHIGVKSVRLRSVSGEQIIVSNADMLKSRVRNFGRMRERRAVFRLNVVYDTPADKLRAIPALVREIVGLQPNTRFDRCHFLAYTDWSLQFEVVYYMTVPDYTSYADVLQAVNLTLIERFAQLGVQFAFQTHFVRAAAPP